MTSPTLSVSIVSYEDVREFGKLHHDEIFYEPATISADLLFAGLNQDKLAALGEGLNLKRYGFLLKLGDETIGWHSARQITPALFSMEGSGIRKEHQGKGYYRTLMENVVAFAKEAGYAAIVSTHAADNNRILIPKLRYGFVIKGFEINPMYGLDVKLIYYFNEGQKKAHQIRVGSRADFNAP
ncbi:MAG: GNAT family N-acetyltransferase [Proteobacteria bacterium]|nr:MAG: GNAT family N-acetyltransferase [Pseudomonadota bacterium]